MKTRKGKRRQRAEDLPEFPPEMRIPCLNVLVLVLLVLILAPEPARPHDHQEMVLQSNVLNWDELKRQCTPEEVVNDGITEYAQIVAWHQCLAERLMGVTSVTDKELALLLVEIMISTEAITEVDGKELVLIDLRAMSDQHLRGFTDLEAEGDSD